MYTIAASPLDPHDAQQVRPVLGRLLLQADTRHLIPVNTPCSQPLCAGLRSSVSHGTGTVTDIPDQPYDLYIYRSWHPLSPHLSAFFSSLGTIPCLLFLCNKSICHAHLFTFVHVYAVSLKWMENSLKTYILAVFGRSFVKTVRPVCYRTVVCPVLSVCV